MKKLPILMILIICLSLITSCAPREIDKNTNPTHNIENIQENKVETTSIIGPYDVFNCIPYIKTKTNGYGSIYEQYLVYHVSYIVDGVVNEIDIDSRTNKSHEVRIGDKNEISSKNGITTLYLVRDYFDANTSINSYP